MGRSTTLPADVQASVATFTQAGVGIVRMRPVLAFEVHDAPAAVALLEMPERERGEFGPAQAATQQHGEDGPVAESFRCREV
jgi:hypothetical protein